MYDSTRVHLLTIDSAFCFKYRAIKSRLIIHYQLATSIYLHHYINYQLITHHNNTKLLLHNSHLFIASYIHLLQTHVLRIIHPQHSISSHPHPPPPLCSHLHCSRQCLRRCLLPRQTPEQTPQDQSQTPR
jgi:hypothetical protein